VLGVDSGWDLDDLADTYKKNNSRAVYFKDYEDPTDFFNAFRQALQPSSTTQIAFDLKNVEGERPAPGSGQIASAPRSEPRIRETTSPGGNLP
jgi:hypothetical protein